MSPVEGVEAVHRVLVCGGRDFSDILRLATHLDQMHFPDRTIALVIEGGAKGADALARTWGRSRFVPVETYVAQWGTDGRSAGPKRNQRMIDEGRPTIVVAFPGGRGTEDMVRRAEASGLKVVRA